MTVTPVHRRRSSGQSATEFMLMLPILLGLMFAVVELALWLGSSHYVTYAAFTGARAVQVGRKASDATDWLLDGRTTRNAVVQEGYDSVRIDMPWRFDLPFVSGMGDPSYEVTVVAGPDEFYYEGLSDPYSSVFADNNCSGSGC